MAVRNRGNRFQADVVIPPEKRTRYGVARVRRAFPTKDEATAWELSADAAILRDEEIPMTGGVSIKERMILSTLRDKVQAAIWNGTKGERTALLNAQAALDYFGPDKQVSLIDSDAIDGYAAHLIAVDGNSNGTVNRKLAALSRMLTFAQENRWIASVPKVRRKKEYEGRVKFLTPEEEATALTAMRHFGFDELADFCIFLVDCGARLSEGLQLEPQDVSPGQSRVTFWQTKGDKPRTVPATTRVRDILKRKLNGSKVFTLDEREIRTQWDRVRAHLGRGDDKQWVLHILRHTCASRLVQRGVDLRRVQKFMGHKTIQTTLRYAHLAPDDLDVCATVLEGLDARPALAVVDTAAG